VKEIKRTDAPYGWAVEQFGGAATGEPIIWMPQEPSKPARSDYVGRWKFAPGFVRIAFTLNDSDGAAQPLNFDQGWQCIVYELYNIAHSRTMNKLLSAARTGSISRDEFIWEGPKCEYDALNKMVAFHRDVWKPWAEKVGVLTDPGVWEIENRAQSYEEWLRRLAERTDRNGFPWKYYGEIYDAAVTQSFRALIEDGSNPKESSTPRSQ
jgi:hypothetical protein